ncbi:MAG: hypothetical protein NTY34_08435 [Candidatus Omnitrophica bacterium]|nr:hypothetical protein [Candidatus Omnitrophota bacterium]
MKLHFRPKKAATLAELVVTMVLICVVTVSAFSAYAYISACSMRAFNYACATEFLCDTLERLSASSYASLATNSTNLLPVDSNLRSRYGGTMSYTVSAETRWDTDWADTTTNGYKNITATITWNDGASRTLTLSMRKTKR